MIELGLNRISLLLPRPLPWRAIHIAGTNGKGSICSYISSLLSNTPIRHGRFTSPHLIDRWDCISINNTPIPYTAFREAESRVLHRNEVERIGASEFEVLTATAFEFFSGEGIEVGVVEVGMGGRLDATNILTNPLVTVIAKIGLDHQAFLGDTLNAIAIEKAGIMKPGVPCVVDPTNDPDALSAIKEAAAKVEGVTLHYPTLPPKFTIPSGMPEHQVTNLATAYIALSLALPRLDSPEPISLPAIPAQLPTFPGRLSSQSLTTLTGRKASVLLDGAHNPQSAAALSSHVSTHLRPLSPDGSVTWLLAVTQGKDLPGLLSVLLQPGDRLVATAFGPVDGMPWVQATKAEELAQIAEETVRGLAEVRAMDEMRAALEVACAVGREGPLVTAGSLYLVGDVLRVMRDVEGKRKEG
ncbi:FolC bifunctional protein [Patellaria atrata CBS 101060]|uniref:FolC bifunctional protein n=1 Tax=Patellaria atrata CBS 101060 TaxID=1346257 RepID=A0A9P4VR59_9PEZI|nr:FolC bifunctional protein [Patellaria atrata CBS 101060]